MLKLVIIEDEIRDREGLKNHIDWVALGLELVGVGENGYEGMDLIRNLGPDLVITDIKMPFMDGIQIAEETKKILPNTRFVFISGHKDFEYAKKAIELNAYDYILKPYMISGFIKTIQGIVNSCAKHNFALEEVRMLRAQIKESLPLLRNKLLTELLFGIAGNKRDVASKAQFLDLSLEETSFCVLLCSIDDHNVFDGMNQGMRYMILVNISEILKSVLNNEILGEAVIVNDYEIAAIITVPGLDNYKDHIAGLVDSVRSNICRQHHINISFGIGNIIHDLEDLYQSFQGISSAMQNVFYYGKNQVFFYDEVQEILYDEPDFHEVEKELLNNMRNGRIEESVTLIHRFFDKLRMSKGLTREYIKYISSNLITTATRLIVEATGDYTSIFGAEKELLDTLMHKDTIPEIEELFIENFISASKNIRIKYVSRNKKIAQMIIEIIEKKYYENINADEIGKIINFSSRYANIIFKQETGESINKYLIKVRMQNARELLKGINVNISETAQKVGYSNIAHFSTCFKDYFGVTPKEYRSNPF